MPFSDREGALLDQMLASVGLKRAAMLLTPLIPWRPPGGRVPNPGELQLYRPFLGRLITLTSPSRIVLFDGARVRGEHGVIGAAHRGGRAYGRVGRDGDRRAAYAGHGSASAWRPAENARATQGRMGRDAAVTAGVPLMTNHGSFIRKS